MFDKIKGLHSRLADILKTPEQLAYKYLKEVNSSKIDSEFERKFLDTITVNLPLSEKELFDIKCKFVFIASMVDSCSQQNPIFRSEDGIKEIVSPYAMAIRKHYPHIFPEFSACEIELELIEITKEILKSFDRLDELQVQN